MKDFFRSGEDYLNDIIAAGEEYPKFEVGMHVDFWSSDGQDLISKGEIHKCTYDSFYIDHFYEVWLDDSRWVAVPTYRLTRCKRTKHLQVV